LKDSCCEGGASGARRNLNKDTISISLTRGKIRLIDGNAKCSHIKKLTCKGTLRQVFICLRPRSTYPPYNVKCTVYSMLIHTGKGGGVEPERRERGATFCFGVYRKVVN